MHKEFNLFGKISVIRVEYGLFLIFQELFTTDNAVINK